MRASIFVLSLFLACVAAAGNEFTVLTGWGNDDGWSVLGFFPQVLQVTPGDTVTFVLTGDEHTITFFYNETYGFLDFATLIYEAAYFETGNGIVLSNTTLYSSGHLLSGDSYTYTFPVVGTFPFYCSIHTSMTGIIEVVSASVPPIPPDDVNVTALEEANAKLSVIPYVVANFSLDKHNVTPITKYVTSQPDYHEYTVFMGAGNTTALVGLMRFVPANLTIYVGDAVVWVATDPVSPHTLALNSSGEFDTGDLFSDAPQGRVRSANGFYLRPYGSPQSYDGGFFSGGLMAAESLDIPGLENITVFFTAPGVYPYICYLHQHMTGVITVLVRPQNVPQLAGYIVWGIIGGALAVGFVVLVSYLIVRTVVRSSRPRRVDGASPVLMEVSGDT